MMQSHYNSTKNMFYKKSLLFVIFSFFLCFAGCQHNHEQPNVLWIYVDDMSDWLGCYGDPIIKTPHIDQLASNGVRFESAFIPSPVCSTTRSALITGTMQTSYGLHHHRTMELKPLPKDMKTIPELFRQSKYITFNLGKDDYNFEYDRDQFYSLKNPKGNQKAIKEKAKKYSEEGDKYLDYSWLEQFKGKKFFGQIQLRGGKLDGETGKRFPDESRFDESKIAVPPQYPNDAVFRNAIARHYEQIAQTDEQVGAIISSLKKYGLWENTVIFFFTDHGSPLPRSKQFLYDEGVKVPLIVHWPNGIKKIGKPGLVRKDLVSGIDIAAASLGLAQITIPSTIEGKDFFTQDYQPQEYIIGARDRCGIAIDRIRTVRSKQYRYIRNFLTDRALYQAQYRDKYATMKHLRKLYSEGKLTPLQASYHDVKKRPAEELYDLQSDPDEVHDLAQDPEYASVLIEHRKVLEKWITDTDDKGQYPETKASLQAVYDKAKGKVESPEFNQFNR